MTEPQPARLWRMACGRNACALCYQFDRKAQQVRRLGTNTIHHVFFMKQLEQMENYAASLIEHDPGLLIPVLQCNAEHVPPWAFNKYGVPVLPPMLSSPGSMSTSTSFTGPSGGVDGKLSEDGGSKGSDKGGCGKGSGKR